MSVTPLFDTPLETLDAMSALKDGQVVGLPSETVYGMAARADDPSAIERLHSLKKSNPTKPLSLCVFSKKQAPLICHVGPQAEQLMNAFWPGPLTLLLPKKQTDSVHSSANSGLDYIGVRCPDTQWRRLFLSQGFTIPLVLTSANFTGDLAPSRLGDVDHTLRQQVGLWLNDEDNSAPVENKQGMASTIISLHNDTNDAVDAVMIRQGSVERRHLNKFPMNWVLTHTDTTS